MSALLQEETANSGVLSYRTALSVLRNLPDHCAMNVDELAGRIGVDKLDLLQWVRADLEFARLIASKVTT